jgi:galactose mutarotase-like enzyme
MSALVVCSPGDASAYLCVEPVTRPVDAHNRREDPAAAGLVDLAPGDDLTVRCRSRPDVAGRDGR